MSRPSNLRLCGTEKRAGTTIEDGRQAAGADGERSMKRWLALLTAVLMICLAAGCGGGTPGVNRDKDKPRSGDSTMDK
jgi:hypothetical protein